MRSATLNVQAMESEKKPWIEPEIAEMNIIGGVNLEGTEATGVLPS